MLTRHNRDRAQDNSYSFVPDRSILNFLPTSTGSKNSNEQVRNQQRTNLNLVMQISVSVVTVRGDTINFRGRKNINTENGNFAMSVNGSIDVDDVNFEQGRSIDSRDVANLVVQVQNESRQPSATLPPTTTSEPNDSNDTNENTQPPLINDEQKRIILMQYLQWLLGQLNANN